MTDIENQTEAVVDETPEIDPIEVIHEADCPSLSGRSTLTYAVGRHKDDGTLHLAITRNSGGGMFCKDWAEGYEIEVIVFDGTELTSKSFQALHPGRSINTAGFVLSALKDLGLIRVHEANTRLHEHVPTTTFEKVVMERIGQAGGGASSVKSKRKSKGTA